MDIMGFIQRNFFEKVRNFLEWSNKMDTEKNSQKAVMNYSEICNLYGKDYANKTDNGKRAIRKTLSKKLDKYLEKNGLSGISWEELPELRRIDFICYEIKKYMLRKKNDSEKEEVEKRLEKYIRSTLKTDDNVLLERNKFIKGDLFKRDYVKERDMTSLYIKEKAYEKFLQNWEAYFGTRRTAPTFETFSEHPNFSVYDYVMTNLSEPNEFVDAEKEIVQSIILQVLEEKFSLKIDYKKIRECLQEQQELISERTGIDLSDFEYEQFPDTFEEYWEGVIHGREDEYTEQDKEEIHEMYDKTREKMIRLSLVKQKMVSLKDFYTIK